MDIYTRVSQIYIHRLIQLRHIFVHVELHSFITNSSAWAYICVSQPHPPRLKFVNETYIYIDLYTCVIDSTRDFWRPGHGLGKVSNFML